MRRLKDVFKTYVEILLVTNRCLSIILTIIWRFFNDLYFLISFFRFILYSYIDIRDVSKKVGILDLLGRMTMSFRKKCFRQKL